MRIHTEFAERVRFIMVKDKEGGDAGPLGGERFSTLWLIDDLPYLVSSVTNAFTTETMLFPIRRGEISYLEVWASKEYLYNTSQHATFLDAYLRSGDDIGDL